jgi:hypothetical protein
MGSKAGNAAYLIRYQQTSLIIKLSTKVACLISHIKKWLIIKLSANVACLLICQQNVAYY